MEGTAQGRRTQGRPRGLQLRHHASGDLTRSINPDRNLPCTSAKTWRTLWSNGNLVWAGRDHPDDRPMRLRLVQAGFDKDDWRDGETGAVARQNRRNGLKRTKQEH